MVEKLDIEPAGTTPVAKIAKSVVKLFWRNLNKKSDFAEQKHIFYLGERKYQISAW